MTDLEILREILKNLHYADTYIQILEEMALQRLMDSGLDNMTPSFLYVTFVNEVGRTTARKIADYFEEMKESGSFTTEFDKLRKEKGLED